MSRRDREEAARLARRRTNRNRIAFAIAAGVILLIILLPKSQEPPGAPPPVPQGGPFLPQPRPPAPQLKIAHPGDVRAKELMTQSDTFFDTLAPGVGGQDQEQWQQELKREEEIMPLVEGRQSVHVLATAYLRRGTACVMLGRYEEAVPWLEKAEKLALAGLEQKGKGFPQGVDIQGMLSKALKHLGDASDQLKQPQAALDYFTRAAVAASKAPTVAGGIGEATIFERVAVAYLRLPEPDPKQALKAGTKAVQLIIKLHKSPAFKTVAPRIDITIKDVMRAAHNLDMDDPDLVPAILAYAKLAELLGRPEEADVWLQEAQRLNEVNQL